MLAVVLVVAQVPLVQTEIMPSQVGEEDRGVLRDTLAEMEALEAVVVVAVAVITTALSVLVVALAQVALGVSVASLYATGQLPLLE
jgi:hypothetical protein